MERMHNSDKKSKSFQGPKVGPGPQPIRAHFIDAISLHTVGKMVQNFRLWTPLLQKVGYSPVRHYYISMLLLCRFQISFHIMLSITFRGLHVINACHLAKSFRSLMFCRKWTRTFFFYAIWTCSLAPMSIVWSETILLCVQHLASFRTHLGMRKRSKCKGRDTVDADTQ